MGIVDGLSNFLSGGGRDDINDSTDAANKALQPYSKYGQLSSQQLQEMIAHLQSRGNVTQPRMEAGRNVLSNEQNTLQGYGNPADYDYRNASRNPTDIYNERMNSYTESPEAKYAQEQALRASNAASSANGLAGSGAQLRELQENANRISQGDRQRYFDNVRGIDADRGHYLDRYQNQNNLTNSNLLNYDTAEGVRNQASIQQILEYMQQLGYGAASGIGSNEIGRGTALAKTDQEAMNGLEGLAGSAISGGYNSFNQAKIPEYARGGY